MQRNILIQAITPVVIACCVAAMALITMQAATPFTELANSCASGISRITP